MSKEFERVSLHNWEVETLRASNFLAPDAIVKAENWWQSIVGADPETEVVKSKLGERLQQGPLGNGRVTLRIQPTRIDWLLNTTIPEQPSEGVLSIGRFDEVSSSFLELVERWFPLSPTLRRIAFGATVLLPSPDRVEGYRQLGEYLPAVKLDPEGSSDFLYRINRKRDAVCGIENLKMNRLSTWSVASIEYRGFEIAPDRTTVARGEPTFACRVELDINTAADFSDIFLPEQSQVVFKELVQLGREVLEKGDVP